MSSSILRKKPAWLKARSTPSETTPQNDEAPPSATSPVDIDEIDMFSRAAHTRTWAADAASARRARQTAETHKASTEEPVSPKPVKRRKVSDEHSTRRAERHSSPADSRGLSRDHSPDVSHSGLDSALPSPTKIRPSIEGDDEHTPAVYGRTELVNSTRSSPRNTRKQASLEKGRQSTTKTSYVSPVPAKNKDPIILEDDDTPNENTNHSSDSESGPGVDEDFDTIVRRAERRRAREQAQANAQPLSPAGKAVPPPHSPRPATPKARLKILVHSPIADTKPMFGEVLLSQPLKLLRTTWCSRQPFDADFAKGVFLTWRGLKIWDWTSCASLGVQVDPHGGVYWKTKGRTGFEDGANLEMQAVTAEIFEQQQKEKTRRSRYESPRDDGSDDAMTQAQATQQASENSAKIRIIVKAQGYEEYKLRVNPDTTFDKIVSAFLKMRNVPPDKRAFLMFDGEQLDGSAVMSDTEVGDLDHLDLHIK